MVTGARLEATLAELATALDTLTALPIPAGKTPEATFTVTVQVEVTVPLVDWQTQRDYAKAVLRRGVRREVARQFDLVVPQGPSGRR